MTVDRLYPQARDEVLRQLAPQHGWTADSPPPKPGGGRMTYLSRGIERIDIEWTAHGRVLWAGRYHHDVMAGTPLTPNDPDKREALTAWLTADRIDG